MTQEAFIKNIVFSEPQVPLNLVDYQEGRVVSRTFVQNSITSLAFFAFDRGEGSRTRVHDRRIRAMLISVSL